MIDPKVILENPKLVEENNKRRGKKIKVSTAKDLLASRAKLIGIVEKLRAEGNAVAAKIPKADKKEKTGLIAEGKRIKEQVKDVEAQLKVAEEALGKELEQYPNILHPDVPVGKDETENKVIRSWGKKPAFSFKPKDHLALGEALGIIDMERAAKVSGARFAYLKGDAVLLEFALMQYAFSILTSESELAQIAAKVGKGHPAKPFVPVLPPVMIRPEVFRRMARLTDEDKDERYYLPQDDLYLIGSAEHTLGSMYMDETLPEENLPLRYVGFSTSFRREAGSYGKDMRGILRVHQFDKLEMESFCLPEQSEQEQDFFVAIQERLLQGLQLPYQVVMICTGDMGKPDARQIDIETWMPGQERYRETHTADLMTDFQARRLNTRVKRKKGNQFVHTNDATVFAGRTIIAILENYQQKDGSVVVPEVLRLWIGKDVISSS